MQKHTASESTWNVCRWSFSASKQMDDLYSLCMVMKTKDQGETNAETVFLNRAIVDSTPIWFSELSFFTKQTQIEKGSAEVPTPHQPKASQVSNEGILKDICK